MIAVDTTVVVAAFAPWHEGHDSANAALARKPRLPAHALLETYSVLTRLPLPHRVPPAVAAAFLADRFPEPPLILPSRQYPHFIERAAALGIPGGSIYDALIAATVRHAGAVLLTLDRRATATYERLKVEYELLA